MSLTGPQAQMLAEMDREFGVGDLVSETFQEEKRQVLINAQHTCSDRY